MKKEDYINSVNLNSTTRFPYLVLDVINGTAIPRNPGFQVMHWHEDLQLIYVLDGAIDVCKLDHAVQVLAGEGLFINKNVVHCVKGLGECHYNSFLFPTYFLEFYAGSPSNALVDDIVTNDQIVVLHFTQTTNWQNDIISVLQQLAEIEKNKTEYYTYEILLLLSSFWLTMRKNIVIPLERKENIVQIRMQKILRYMEKHYAEDLTLADLAKSANISKSECSRCFKLSLNTTPYKYLTEYRLLKAAQLLTKTNEPIGNIAASVGFHQMSHFGKCFREKTGCSPKEYRTRESSTSNPLIRLPRPASPPTPHRTL